MIQRLVFSVLALAAMAAAAGVVVVSAAFALYTLLRDYLGPAGAAAVIAFGFAVVLAIAAFMMFGRSKRVPAHKVAREATFVERVTDTLRQRPIIAAGAATAAGLLAWKNPQLVAIVLRALEPRVDRESGPLR